MPRQPSVRALEKEADEECRAHFGSALDGFSIVPTALADKLLGPPRADDSIARLRKECLVLAKGIGKIQTGQAVDHRWASAYLTLLGLEALGVEMWDFATEDNAAALAKVIEVAKSQHRHDDVARTCEALDEQGSPF